MKYDSLPQFFSTSSPSTLQSGWLRRSCNNYMDMTFKADIWSFGFTVLELARGHAPFSKYPPTKVLLMTPQNAPRVLTMKETRFSKSFKEMVAACLVKDPKKRPTSEKLMKHPFFKHARLNEYLTRTILEGLAPLGDRFRTLKAKEADMLV